MLKDFNLMKTNVAIILFTHYFTDSLPDIVFRLCLGLGLGINP